LKLLQEAAAKRFEREHNARIWHAWHVVAFQRMKKMPPLKTLFVKETSKPRQTWRQQLEVMKSWAAKHNAREVLRMKALEKLNNG
jgi:hypothetical protein